MFFGWGNLCIIEKYKILGITCYILIICNQYIYKYLIFFITFNNLL